MTESPALPHFLRLYWHVLDSTIPFLQGALEPCLDRPAAQALALARFYGWRCTTTAPFGFASPSCSFDGLVELEIRWFGAAVRTRRFRKLGTKRKSSFVRASGRNEAKHVAMFCRLEILKAFLAPHTLPLGDALLQHHLDLLRPPAALMAWWSSRSDGLVLQSEHDALESWAQKERVLLCVHQGGMRPNMFIFQHLA